MRLNFKIPALIAVLIIAPFLGAWANAAASSSEGDSKALQGPRAVFPETKYKFEPLFEGDDVTHDFVVENRGDAPLVIKNVKPG